MAKTKRCIAYIALFFAAAVLILSGCKVGSEANATAANDMGPKHKVVIQVSSNDAQTQVIALNNAANLQKAYGMDDVDVQIVAYGPGLSLLTSDSSNSSRVSSLAMQNIGFNACGNTMSKIKAKTGKDPELSDGVSVVASGVARIMELQEQGYSYVRP